MTTAIVQRSVDFHGDRLVVIQQDGIEYTPAKPVCDRFGIDWEGQRQRIARDEVLDSATCMIKAQIPGDDQRRDHVCLPLDYLNGWLFGVDVGRIRPELRERMILYKRECYRVLAQAFRGGEGTAPLARVEALEYRVAHRVHPAVYAARQRATQAYKLRPPASLRHHRSRNPRGHPQPGR